VSVVERLGLQIGTWMNMFSSCAPPSAMSAFTLGRGVAPLGAIVGNEAPSIWSWSSVTK